MIRVVVAALPLPVKSITILIKLYGTFVWSSQDSILEHSELLHSIRCQKLVDLIQTFSAW